MNDPGTKITFEIHVLQQGRWELQGTYTQDKQAAAIRDAKALENISTITGVKVIREELNTKNGKSKENNVYATKNLTDEQPKGLQEARKAKEKAKAMAKPAKEKNPNAAIAKDLENYNPDAADAPAFSVLGFLIKILMVMLFSAIISMFVTGVATVWLRESAFGVNTQSNIIFGMFIGTFAICVVSMGWSMLSKAKILTTPRAVPVPTRAKKPNLTPSLEDFKPKLGGPDDSDDHKPGTEEAARLEEGPDTRENEDTPETEATPGSAPKVGFEAVVPMEEDPKLKMQKEYVMDFMESSMGHANISRLSMDNFNKFGVSLFMAGACETLSQERNLDGQMMAKVVSEPVKQLGFKGGDTESFSDKIQGYLLADSRYMQMFQAGRVAMTSYMESDLDSLNHMKRAMAEWNSPKSKAAPTGGPVTVLFTDIAGSTNMTQTLGDAVAQQVVRAHNKIVREALMKFQGKEIKHTGDGIMASFSNTSNGVDAAADMQTGTVKHNTENPGLPLGLKIGINAGEPIAEDNDLFGTTVQLAARIVDKAQAGQIYLSETVQGICSGKNYRFSRVGSFDMKGFDEGIRLYELIWDVNAPMPEQPMQEPEIKQAIVAGAPDEPEAAAESTEPIAAEGNAPAPLPEAAAETVPETATDPAEAVAAAEEDDAPQAT